MMETKKKTQNELYLPHELILQILLRLPVKSLLRFKCVCKSWFSLISDPHFATSHFEITHTHRLMFISNSDTKPRSVDFEESLHDVSAISISHKLNLPLTKRFQSPEIKGSCRGIIVIRFNSKLYLWNPSTGVVHRQVTLSPNDDHLYFFGFGYDKSTDDYLLISMLYDYFEFFSLRDNKWKETEITHIRYTYLDNDHDYDRYHRPGLLFNGAIHWLAYRHDHDLKESVIVAFDLRERKLLDIQLPLDFEPKLHKFGLWVFGEFLSLWSRSTDDREKDTVEIWVMNEYKLHSSWTKKTSVLPLDGFADKYLVPLCSTKSGDIVMTDNYGTGLAKYDCKGQLLEYRNYDNQGYKVALYIESLLSLDNEQV